MPRATTAISALALAAAIAGSCDTPTELDLEPVDILFSGSTTGTLPSIDDTFLRLVDPNQNRGSLDRMWVRGTGGKSRALVKWDQTAITSAIGTGSLISATLELNVDTAFGWGSSGRFIAAYRLTQDWTELGATFNCADDTDTSNDVADCSGPTAWVMGDPPSARPWGPPPVDSGLVVNEMDGILSLDVTSDVQDFMSGSAENFGWLITKTDESRGGRLRLASREGTIPPQLRLVVEAGGPLVPPTPPDSIPQALIADSNLVQSPTSSTRWPRDVLMVMFQAGASQADKDAAVALVSGTTVGGQRISDDGYFLVQVPHDGTDGPLLQAIETLRQLPQVRSATRFFLLEIVPNHLRSNDGVGWTTLDWDLRPGDASGANWSLERIAAPLGWGCTLGGDSTTPIAVLDHQFTSTSDLAANLNTALSRGVNAFTNPPNPHATWISSILGAEGDNGVGIAGLMWRSDLRFREIQPLDLLGQPTGGYNSGSYATQADTALRDGALVLNLSFMPESLSAAPTAADSVRAGRLLEPTKVALQIRQSEGAALPLLVVAAGNDSVHSQDAFFSSFPILRDSFPDNVLVVAASDSLDNLWTGSRRGGLVEVAAPGVNVQALGANNSVFSVTGTSAAAPLVSGLAGLLLSFDPSLTIPEVKDLIVQGAVNGGRTAGGIPIINAYESLKLAAERVGGAICGNQMWIDGTSAVVRRSATFTDAIATIAGMTSIIPYHGGHRIDIATGPGNLGTLAFQQGQWQFGSQSSGTAATPTGAFRSGRGVSHDLDTTITNAENLSDTVLVNIQVNHVITGRVRIPGHIVAAFAENTAFPPLGDLLVVPIRPTIGSGTVFFYTVSLSPLQVQGVLFAESDVGGVGVALSEDGTQLMTIIRSLAAPTVCTIVRRSFPTGVEFERVVPGGDCLVEDQASFGIIAAKP